MLCLCGTVELYFGGAHTNLALTQVYELQSECIQA